MKDIFIDTNAVVKFTNPPTEDYKKLILWLKSHSENKDLDPHLVLSKQIIKEYHDSVSGGCIIENNIHLIIALMSRNDRINSFTSQQIKDFKNEYFTKNKTKKIRSNWKDNDHIPIVLMSERKMGLILDINLKYDLENFSNAIEVHVEDAPEKLNYAT